MPLIDQQEALNALTTQADEMSWWHERCDEQRKGILTAVRIVSDIKPKRGKWKDGKCDQCSGSAPFWPLANTYYYSNFCPHCGADMREVRKDGTN